MKYLIIPVLLLACYFFKSCKEPIRLDETKLDNFYFLGEYETNYMGEKEILVLKKGGYYDYQLIGKKQDTTIKNIENWELIKSEKYSPTLLIKNYPNIRLDRVFEEDYHEERVSVSFNVNNSYEGNLGDLETLVIDGIGGEGNYVFKKKDKLKNKDYILKSE
jgi:hypothetical protein